ncbi:MAG TPA: FtsX-like permease family protein [Conexibacter sp.]|nr:FtsX-like permease family protein [Conexibacter sp.]
MKTRNLLFLYVQRIRAHPFQELLALLGIAVGVALMFAVLVANASVSGSVEQLVHSVTGRAQLQLAARDPHGFDAELARRVAHVPGVRATAPLVDVRANVTGPSGAVRTVDLVGGDDRLVAIGGALLRELVSPHIRLTGAVALPARLAADLGVHGGGTVQFATGSPPRAVPVATVLGRAEVGALVDSPIALAPLDYAQRLAGLRGRYSSVLVEVRRGRLAQVRARLRALARDRVNVVSADHEAQLLQQAAEPNDQSTALFAGISALVGLLFAFNAMLLTVPERRRFIADLRLEGLGDLTVVRLVLLDALVLGAAASALGLLLGDALSRNAFGANPGYLSYAFAVGDQRIVSSASVLLAILGGLFATLVAALRPLSDLLSRRPLDDAYREDDERTERAVVPRAWQAAAGVALVAAASGVLLAAPRATIVGIGLLVGAMLLLIPSLLTSALRAIDLGIRNLHSPLLVVAVGELRATTTRSIALAATGALAVFGSVAVEGSHFDLQRGLDKDAHAFNRRADLWVAPSGPTNELATITFHPPPAARRLATLPGVRAVHVYRGAFLDVGARRVWVVAPSRAEAQPLLPSQLLEGDLTAANERLRGSGWVGLSKALVVARGLHIGDSVTLPTPHPLRMRLAAILTNLGWSAGAVLMNATDFARGWASDDVGALQVLLRPGVAPTTAAARVRALLGPRQGLTVETSAQREQRFRASTRQGLGRLTQIARLVLVAAALALAAALGGVVWNRRPRLASLKLSGFSDSDVWRALMIESAVVLTIGCSIGALFGLFGQYMLTRWLSDSTGFPTAYAPAITLALSTFAGITLVAVAIAALPGLAAARVSPAAAPLED